MYQSKFTEINFVSLSLPPSRPLEFILVMCVGQSILLHDICWIHHWYCFRVVWDSYNDCATSITSKPNQKKSITSELYCEKYNSVSSWTLGKHSRPKLTTATPNPQPYTPPQNNYKSTFTVKTLNCIKSNKLKNH